jgi:hypothetical protein
VTPSRPHTRLNSSSGQVHSMGQLSDRQSDQRPLIVSPVVSFTWVAHQANPFTDWSIVHLLCSTPPKVNGNTQGSSDTVRHSGSGASVVVVVVEVVVVVVVVCPPLHNPVRVSHFGFPRLPSPDSGLSLSGHLLASESPTTSKVARRDPAPGLIVSVCALL